MSSAGTPVADPWVVQPRERKWYEDQFKSLNPINGVVTGEQAKGFLLQSQLPPAILGQIWALSDTDADGKMDINEFSIACKLIHLKLKGTEIPKALPFGLVNSLKMFASSITSPPSQPMPTAPARPQPPKVDNLINQPQLIQTVPSIPPQPVQPTMAPLIQTAVVQPMVPVTPRPIPQQGIAAPMMGGTPTGMGTPGMGTPAMSTPVMGTPLGAMGGVAPIMTAPLGAAPLPIMTQPVAPLVAPVIPSIPPPAVPPLPAAYVSPVTATATAPSISSTPRASFDKGTPRTSIDKGIMDLQQGEWSIPHQTKLKYTQLFNTTDRARTGYLSGVQARNVMVQSKLPQNILAQIWALSDMDSDGQLGCEEFVLAMHLCEQATVGVMPPTVLSPDLIPPTFRRAPRQGSISSQGSISQDVDHSGTIGQTTFEDKRKENFEKGQAELERRRKALLEAQRKEAEERERKEREENERRERAKQEAERKRLKELEAQMREQEEAERQKEEERKRQADQREAARKEMERQRQLEWEKQRSQELQQQRQREQEKVLKLKAKNQTLSIELSSLNEQVKELSQKICDTRVGVSNIKSTIDGMRSTRDTQMQEMSQLKNKLKEQNARLLALSHEKAKLEAKNKLNAQQPDQQNEQTKAAFDNKEIIIKQLKDKLEDMQSQIQGKMNDIDNNNTQLSDLKKQLNSLVSECENLYGVYEEKKNTVLEMKGASKTTQDYTTGGDWNDTSNWDTAGNTDNWPVSSNWEDTSAHTDSVKYRALYEFVARNGDEISFQPGDIIMVPLEQKGEPGWMAGEIRGHTGWFPESYVEKVEAEIEEIAEPTLSATEVAFAEDTETKRLEGIAEVPETLNEQIITEPVAEEVVVEKDEAVILSADSPVEYYVSSYPYQSVEQGDLSFNVGEMIIVIKKEGDWWTGKIGNNVGIFPSNYVQKVEATNEDVPTNTNIEQLANSEEQQQPDTGLDSEVCQINDGKAMLEKSPDFAAMAANSQTIRSGKKPEIASVIAPYQATSTEQLSLQRGQLIMVRKKTDSGWWEGELQAKGRRRQIGWFPASYVKVLSSSGRASGRTTPVSASRMQQEVIIDKVIALFPYTANNPDELSFLKDDIISVTARDEPSWWRGELNGVSGLFPSNYVGPLQSYYLEDKGRQDSINELISTEKAYVDDMTIVYDVFEWPLRNSKVVSAQDVDGIFVNWQEIIQSNRELLKDLLNQRDQGSLHVGHVLCKHLPRMNGYVEFCNRQLDSAALLQCLTETSSAFRDLMRQCQSHPATRGMPLSSYLIKPMQRITKYPLVISKILETTPITHPDHQPLTEALDSANRFCKLLNEGVRHKENSERLHWLQTHVNCDDLHIKFDSETNCLGPRRLLHFGVLHKVKSGRELLGFLLNDFLLLVQSNKPIGSKQFTFQRNTNCTYKIYRQPLLVAELTAWKASTDTVENGTDANRVLKLQTRSYQMSLLASSTIECALWLRRINDACTTHNQAKLSRELRGVRQLTGPARGRLLVMVQRSSIARPLGRCLACRVSLGDQEHTTKAVLVTMAAVPMNTTTIDVEVTWDASMQFHVRNVNDDVIVVTVIATDPYSPDDPLGTTELRLRDLARRATRTVGPTQRRLPLDHSRGHVDLKLDLCMFHD